MGDKSPWTPELIEDAVNLTPRQFQAKHPNLFSPAAVHIKRRRLRDAGVDCVSSPIGRKADPVAITLPDLPDDVSDQELWDAFDQMQVVLNKHDKSQSLYEVDIKIETDRPFGVVFMSDFHLGNKGVDHKRLREDIELINTCDRLKAYVGGDGIDNFIIGALSHVHRDASVTTLDVQYMLFKSCIKSLLPSLLAVGTGNHDAWTHKLAGVDANLHALAGLPVLHTREDTYLNLNVGEQEYVVYRKHRPTRTSQNNDGHGVQHMFRFGQRAFDIGVMEHHHTPHISSFWAHKKFRWAIRTGSYKVEDPHAQEWGFHNGGIGTPVIVFDPFIRNMVPFMSITDAIDFLEKE